MAQEKNRMAQGCTACGGTGQTLRACNVCGGRQEKTHQPNNGPHAGMQCMRRGGIHPLMSARRAGERVRR